MLAYGNDLDAKYCRVQVPSVNLVKGWLTWVGPAGLLEVAGLGYEARGVVPK